MADSRHLGDGGGGGEDRISNLPDNILHRILYYAGMRLAMQVSILSSRWRDLWRFMPHLNFNVEEFSGYPSPNKSLYDYAFWVRYFRHTEVRVQKVRLARLHEPNPIKIILREDDPWVGDERFRIGAGLEELELCNVEHGDVVDYLQTLRLLFRPWNNPYQIIISQHCVLLSSGTAGDTRTWFLVARERLAGGGSIVGSLQFQERRDNDRHIENIETVALWHVARKVSSLCSQFGVTKLQVNSQLSLCLGSSPYVREAFLDLITDEGGTGSVIEILGAIHNVKTLTLSSSIVKPDLLDGSQHSR